MDAIKDIYKFYSDWFDALRDVEFDGCHYGCSVEELHTEVHFKVLEYVVDEHKILQGVKLRANYGDNFFVDVDTDRCKLSVYDNSGHGLYGSISSEASAYITAYFAEYDV